MLKGEKVSKYFVIYVSFFWDSRIVSHANVLKCHISLDYRNQVKLLLDLSINSNMVQQSPQLLYIYIYIYIYMYIYIT